MAAAGMFYVVLPTNFLEKLLNNILMSLCNIEYSHTHTHIDIDIDIII